MWDRENYVRIWESAYFSPKLRQNNKLSPLNLKNNKFPAVQMII